MSLLSALPAQWRTRAVKFMKEAAASQVKSNKMAREGRAQEAHLCADELEAALQAGGWQPTEEQQETINEMRMASDLSDEAVGTTEYTARMYALALIAREFLRRLPSAPRAQGETT